MAVASKPPFARMYTDFFNFFFRIGSDTRFGWKILAKVLNFDIFLGACALIESFNRR